MRDALPLWSAGVPLWLGPQWLWLRADESGYLYFWRGEGSTIVDAGPLEQNSQATSSGAPAGYDVIVLDSRMRTKPVPEWLPMLARRLSAGGLLVICAMRRTNGIEAELAAGAATLVSAGWHTIEPGQDDNWWLRPDTLSMLDLAHTLNPPYSTRAWLSQLRRRMGPGRGVVYCLLAWKAEDPS